MAVTVAGGSVSEVAAASDTGGKTRASTAEDGVALVRSSASTAVVGISVASETVGAGVATVPVV